MGDLQRGMSPLSGVTFLPDGHCPAGGFLPASPDVRAANVSSARHANLPISPREGLRRKTAANRDDGRMFLWRQLRRPVGPTGTFSGPASPPRRANAYGESVEGLEAGETVHRSGMGPPAAQAGPRGRPPERRGLDRTKTRCRLGQIPVRGGRRTFIVSENGKRLDFAPRMAGAVPSDAAAREA